jgi:hypothetical protein
MMWGAWQCCSAHLSLGVKQTPRVSLGNSQPAPVMATLIFKPSCKDKALGSEDFFIKIQSLNKLKRSERCKKYIFQKVWEHRLSERSISHLTLPLAEVIAKLEKGENVSKYSLSKGVLYCRASACCRPQIVVPRAIVPTLFWVLSHILCQRTCGGLQDNKEDYINLHQEIDR